MKNKFVYWFVVVFFMIIGLISVFVFGVNKEEYKDDVDLENLNELTLSNKNAGNNFKKTKNLSRTQKNQLSFFEKFDALSIDDVEDLITEKEGVVEKTWQDVAQTVFLDELKSFDKNITFPEYIHPYQVSSLFRVNNNEIYAVVKNLNYLFRGTDEEYPLILEYKFMGVIKSVDNGKTWIKVYEINQGDVLDFSVCNKTINILIAHAGGGGSGEVFIKIANSFDGGENWHTTEEIAKQTTQGFRLPFYSNEISDIIHGSECNNSYFLYGNPYNKMYESSDGWRTIKVSKIEMKKVIDNSENKLSWNLYENKNLGISFKYPSIFSFKSDDDEMVIFTHNRDSSYCGTLPVENLDYRCYNTTLKVFSEDKNIDDFMDEDKYVEIEKEGEIDSQKIKWGSRSDYMGDSYFAVIDNPNKKSSVIEFRIEGNLPNKYSEYGFNNIVASTEFMYID